MNSSWWWNLKSMAISKPLTWSGGVWVNCSALHMSQQDSSRVSSWWHVSIYVVTQWGICLVSLHTWSSQGWKSRQYVCETIWWQIFVTSQRTAFLAWWYFFTFLEEMKIPFQLNQGKIIVHHCASQKVGEKCNKRYKSMCKTDYDKGTRRESLMSNVS